MKLTFAQHCALVDAIASGAVTAKMIGSSIATMKALERRGFVKNDGPTVRGQIVWRITDAGRNAMKEAR